MRVDKEPCDKTTGSNYPKSALCLVAITCAATSFPHGERTRAGVPCLVLTTFARSHAGAMTLNGGLLHFCAILMMRRRYFLTVTEQEHDIYACRLPRRAFESLRAQRPLDYLAKQHVTPSDQKTKMRRAASTIAETRWRDIAAENNFSIFDSFRTTLPLRSY
jgi:hypothetical protein